MKFIKINNKGLSGDRNTFTLIGLVVTLAVVLSAFKIPLDSNSLDSESDIEFESGVMIETTPVIKLTTPKTTKTSVATISEKFKIVKDDRKPVDIIPDDKKKFKLPIGSGLNPDTMLGDIPPTVRLRSAPALFKKGSRGFRNYLVKNLRYPEWAKEFGIEGQVDMDIYINEEGIVESVTVNKTSHEFLDEEVKRVVMGSPEWIPALDRNLPIGYTKNVVVNFDLTK